MDQEVRFNIVNPLTGFLTKAADTAIERYSMQTENKRIIASTESDGTPPSKIVADANLAKEKNTNNVEPKKKMTMRLDRPGMFIGGGILILLGILALRKRK